MAAWLYGPIIWAAHFFLLYGTASFLCTPEASREDEVRLIALALTALALLVLFGLSTWQFIGYRRPRGNDRAGNVVSFLQMTSIALAGLAIIGVMWTGAGAILVPACVPLTG